MAKLITFTPGNFKIGNTTVETLDLVCTEDTYGGKPLFQPFLTMTTNRFRNASVKVVSENMRRMGKNVLSSQSLRLCATIKFSGKLVESR